jgi:outer membrane protein assembly factor BamB
MKRLWLIWLCLGTLLPTGTLLAQQQVDPRSPSTFAFLHITDLHQTATGSLEPLKNLANATYTMPIRPSLVIATGNVTETGSLAEYDKLKQGLAPFREARIEFFAVPGSHDTRWTPDGKRTFAKHFEKTYRSFDYEGTHFILLDSTVRLSSLGHLDTAQLEWLAKDLKRVRAETPIFLFLHHDIGREHAGVRPLDNEYDLFPLFKERNLIAIFTGCGNEDRVWKIRGTTAVMAKRLDQGSYHRVTVSPVIVTIERISAESPKPTTVAQIPVKGYAAHSRLRAGWNDPDVPYLERKRPAAVLEPRAFEDVVEGEVGEYRIDAGEWHPMKRDSRDIWSEIFKTKKLPIGVHTATVRITTSNRAVLEQELIFEIERDITEPTRRWATNLKDAIQSTPILSQNRIIASCLDGRLYGLDKVSGKIRWSLKTEGEIVASPLLASEVLYIGSTDGFVYAVDAESGRLRWKHDVASPLVSTPALARGIVCVGAEGKIVGLKEENGEQVWMTPTKGFFQSQAATDGTNFYLGGWDNTLYAVEALTGRIAWRRELGSSDDTRLAFYNSPAIASPVTAQGRVFVATQDGFLHALSANDGTPLWKIGAKEGSGSFGYSSPTLRGGTLYIASWGHDGNVFAVDANTGSIVWESKTGQAILTSGVQVAPDGKTLAVIGVRGNVCVLDTTTGKTLWNYALGPGNVLSSPAYDGRTVYTTTMANDVQALNAPGEGRPIGSRRIQKSN